MTRMISKWPAGALIVALALLALPALAEDTVIANLGSQPVTASQIKDYLPTLTPAQRAQAAKDPKLSLQLVRLAVARKLLFDEATKQNWDKRPEVAAQIERYREEVIVATYLASVAALPAGYPSADDVRQAYDANREKFTAPAQYHLSQIFIAEPADAKKDVAAAAAARARDLFKKAKAKGADFAELARVNSDDAVSAPKGGDLGWLPESQIVPDILFAVKATGRGITEPVHAAGGWHILWVMGSKPPTIEPLDQVHDTLVALLRETKLNQTEQAYLEKSVEDQHLTVNETAAATLFDVKK